MSYLSPSCGCSMLSNQQQRNCQQRRRAVGPRLLPSPVTGGEVTPKETLPVPQRRRSALGSLQRGKRIRQPRRRALKHPRCRRQRLRARRVRIRARASRVFIPYDRRRCRQHRAIVPIADAA